jgi:hypothetical protein
MDKSIQNLRERRAVLAKEAVKALLDDHQGDKWTKAIGEQVDAKYAEIEAIDDQIAKRNKQLALEAEMEEMTRSRTPRFATRRRTTARRRRAWTHLPQVAARRRRRAHRRGRHVHPQHDVDDHRFARRLHRAVAHRGAAVRRDEGLRRHARRGRHHPDRGRQAAVLPDLGRHGGSRRVDRAEHHGDRRGSGLRHGVAQRVQGVVQDRGGAVRAPAGHRHRHGRLRPPRLAQRLGRLGNTAFTVGTGTTQPDGVVPKARRARSAPPARPSRSSTTTSWISCTRSIRPTARPAARS